MTARGATRSPVVNSPKKTIWKRMWEQKLLILMSLLPMALLIIFKYVPIYGVLIAFKNYKASKGVWGSAWLDPFYKNFQTFFKNVNSGYIIWNTFRVGVLTLIFTYPMPILFALMLNELKAPRFKRVVQTASYIPHFISVVVICSMLNSFGSINGMFNDIRSLFGMARINMNDGDAYFLLEYIGSAVWQGTGWGSIMYLSALSNVDTSLYDVANLDGANRLQQVIHITLPGLMPTITILFILRMGNILNVGYEKILLLYNPSTYEVADVLSTYTYRTGLENQQYSLSTAVGLFNTMVNVVFLLITNYISKKSTESGLF